ncbi:MAG TPA: PAS domain-containing protein [Rectinemataceae bacterium]|nr:PAS domain-containing protein [Rectinemataceae bacterium]
MIEDPFGVLDAMPVPVGSTDAGLKCRFANRAYAGLLGLSQDRMQGMSIRELWGDAIVDEVLPYLRRALEGERVTFTKRLRMEDGRDLFGKAELIPDSTGGYIIVMQDLGAYERSVRDRDALIHELDHRVNNILQILHSVIALELQAAEGPSSSVLEAIKSRVDALGLSYEILRESEVGSPSHAHTVLKRVAAAIGPGLSARIEADEDLVVKPGCLDAFIFIAAELARWVGCEGDGVLLVARRVPDGLELYAEGKADPTSCAGAAGLALVDSFAQSCGAGPLRGGRRPSIIFPD